MRRRAALGRVATAFGAILSGALLIATLSSCAGSGSAATASAVATPTSFVTAAKKQLGQLPGVDSVTVGQSPLDSSTGASPDPTDASRWNVSLDVRMLPGATSRQLGSAATATHDFSESHATSAPWTASILAGGDAAPYAEDTAPLPAIQVQVFPTQTLPAATLSAATLARAALAVKKVPGVDRVAFGRSLASVDVLDVAELAAVYDRVQHLVLFEHGGSYGASAGRVQIMDVPARVSDASIHAIIDLGVRYAGANVALTAVTVGPQYPELYLDHVSLDEASEITATLTGLDRTAVTKGDYPLPFHMRALDQGGTTDTSGYFGGTP